MVQTDKQAKHNSNDVDISTQELLKILHTPHGSAEARESVAEALYQRYAQEIMFFIQSKVSDWNDQLDIHAEVWMFVYEQLPRFTWRSGSLASDPFRSWLFAIAQRKVLEHLRCAVVARLERITAQHAYVDKYDTLDGFEIDNPSKISDTLQFDETLRQGLLNLNEIERKVILLTYLSGKNSTEISGILQLPATTIRSHRSRAIKHLRQFFRQHAASSMVDLE